MVLALEGNSLCFNCFDDRLCIMGNIVRRCVSSYDAESIVSDLPDYRDTQSSVCMSTCADGVGLSAG